MTIAALILAAGEGSRFVYDHGEGTIHKLLAPLRGKPVVRWVLDAVIDAGFTRIYVVTGAADLTSVLDDVRSGLVSAGPSHPAPAVVIEVPAPDWVDGQARTLQAGVRRARLDGMRAVVVGLGDQPMVPAAAWRSVAAASGPVAMAEFDGSLRPPVKLEREVWDLLPTEGDEGARTLILARPDLLSRIPCRGNPADIDTAEDLARWS
ncbi:MAG: NTP transferase domain-containing protein [Actinomycetota bacterium]|nr:NTP transferase domain-containing protein [Actinomycetota bacterium]